MKRITLAAALLMALSGTAQAAPIISSTVVPDGGTTSFALVNFGSGGATNSDGKTGAASGVSIAGSGFTVNFGGTSGVYRGDAAGTTRSPFRAVGGAPTAQHYLNRRAGAGSTNFMTLVFDTPQTAFDLLWGSVDSGTSYNKLKFEFVGGETVDGSTVKALAAGSTFGTSNLAVRISNLTAFTTVVVSADSEAFEFNPGVAVSRVPDGGATLALLGGALMGLGILRRKFSV